MLHAMIERVVDPAASETAGGSGRWRLRLVVPVGAAILLFLIIAAIAFNWARTQADAETARKAAGSAAAQAGLLASELQKFQLLPVVLTEHPTVLTALKTPTPDAIRQLNEKLESLARRTDASAIYLIRPNGQAIAASNWRTPTSFVGRRYAFRPYFVDALRTGSAQFFALGTITLRPGLYIGRRVVDEGRILGVLVVKVEFDRIEAAWRAQKSTVMVTDRDGVVLITSRPQWRFRAAAPIDPGLRAKALRTRQFGTSPIRPIDLARAPDGSVRIDGERHLSASAPLPLLGATVTSFAPSRPDRDAASATARTISLSTFIALALACAIIIRARERQTMESRIRAALETQVAARTGELRDANSRLIAESRERARADARFRRAREELAQANRLGSLGQITAGVAHEINQPVSAIRTFAENAVRLSERGDGERVRGNLAIIVEMTERIGSITAELRKFARRGTPEIGSVPVQDVLEGSRLLLGDSLRAADIQLEQTGDIRGVSVVADRVRLEQIIVNLVQNAIQALAGRPAPHIRIDVTAGSDVTITVADNGPGIDPAIAPEIFTPFVTGKRDGLGLGLGIARDIAREFGGELKSVASPLSGAAFELRLRRS